MQLDKPPRPATFFSGRPLPAVSTAAGHHTAQEDLEPSPPLTDYFESVSDVQVTASDATFRVYQTRADAKPLFVFHHGAGHTALSWALLVGLLRERIGSCSVLAYDCRGHGNERALGTGTKSGTETADDGNLSLEQLAKDLANVINTVYPTPPSDVILVGHSLGGAVVAHVAAAAPGTMLKKPLLGVVVIDVVEGTAMDSLAHMSVYLRNRPDSFPSLYKAVEWSIMSTIRNEASARISVPSQLKPVPNADHPTKWVWRTDLLSSQVHWKGWFEGLSKKFLTSRAARLLILAGTDRLDTELTIGQMQGKYQLALYPESGHAIQEDEPERLAATLVEFWERNGPGKIIKRFPIPVKSVAAAPATAPPASSS
ncbi:Protein phosphatase methylesterase 1 [Geranomyces michiganensis]|nr:Protein phosphatase methylesterase 1 [Geranomyces michiganensis]